MKEFFYALLTSLLAVMSCTQEPPRFKPIENNSRDLVYTFTKENHGIDLTIYFPTEETNIRVAVIACPGGSYSSHGAHEGAVWAPYFNQLGVAFAVLEYTLPNGDPSKPIDDMERALSILYSNADQWLIDRDKIGVMGFSAGGHLACYAATTADYPEDLRPDFQILVYPVVTMSTGTHAGSRTNLLGSNPTSEEIRKYSNELWVTSATPKAFITYAKSETVVPPVYNGKAFYDAMKAAGADAELVELEGTKHGWSHGNSDHEELYLQPMKAKLTPWLRGL